jgi:hypothetical protein
MTTCSTPRSGRKPSLVTLLSLVSAFSLSCSVLSRLAPLPGEEAGGPSPTQGGVLPEGGGSSAGAAKAPAVMGFVLDPDGAPVAYASVAGEIADSNGTVSGNLTGSPSGWLEVQALGYATGYAKPGAPIGGTAFFEARLTPFDAFQPLRSGEEVVLTLGDVAQPVAEITLAAEAVSALPAYIEATVYDRVDVGPYLAELSSGEALDLELALSVVATSDQAESVSLASGKTVSLKLFPNENFPKDPVMAIFNPEKGVWEDQAGACAPADEGVLKCAVPRFSPLVGFFGPSQSVTSVRFYERRLIDRAASGVKSLYRQAPTDDDQAYQDAKTDVEEWGRIGEGQMSRTGTTSPDWDAEMANRLGKFADAAMAYAASHPDESGISHVLAAAQAAMLWGNQELADKLLSAARATAESMADELLNESDCGRIREMLHVMQVLILVGGSQAKVDALNEKLTKLFDCDIWAGTIDVKFHLTSANPNLDRYTMESGGADWTEHHEVRMVTNIQTYVLKGEDLVTLDFPEVQYGYKDRDGCHKYLTHTGVGGGGALKFDGRYDGYAFTVGDLQPEGGSSATITYGAHMEKWDSEKKECVVLQDQTVPAPNYTTVLRHGFSGSPPITIQEMLRGGDKYGIQGNETISNDAFELGIYPFESGFVRWYFSHVKIHLPRQE